jgi:hypothetical protein
MYDHLTLKERIMQNVQAGNTPKTVDGSNLTNGYIEIQVAFPTPFQPKLGPVNVVADFLHPSVNTTDPKNCCTDNGLRDISPTGFIKVIGLSPATKSGDTITVFWTAWQ